MAIAEAALPALGVLFGLLVGSFLNVCIYRMPRDLSVVLPRSFCPECATPIAWYDNIPVLSFILLQGRCRLCSQAIAWRYPLVELATATAFALVLVQYGWSLAAIKWLLFESLMIVLFCTDLEERLLLDGFTLGGAVLGLLFALFVPVQAPALTALLSLPDAPWLRSGIIAAGSAVILALTFWAVAKIYERFRQPEALGFGDVKLLFLLGAFLGLNGGVLAAMIGSIAGATLGIGYALVTHQNWRTTSLPFGTFLCAGGAIIPLLPHL